MDLVSQGYPGDQEAPEGLLEFDTHLVKSFQENQELQVVREVQEVQGQQAPPSQTSNSGPVQPPPVC